ncbi:unnamed protein product [Medioppia subpectinata]|uniref:UMP/CMP kinase n=1 Tax=Medioppia subpectinata TaxID=1979941 RepID=A0A7R9KDB8_9ACAR|nr:unnamed protein product [Medioppia subpectinata]CAG2101351.1 unnamed protein product [Medioppia subpectinata]
MSSGKPWVVFVLGAPGAGKGTQCQLICKEFGFIHLSAGDLLRAECNAEGSQYGELFKSHTRNGTILPVEITLKVLEKAMKSSSAGGEPSDGRVGKFLIDGFPRNQNNLDGWQTAMTHKADLKCVLVLDCPPDVCIDRCLTRGRTDDNTEILGKRIDNYLSDTLPIVEYYRRLNLVREVNANLPPDQVFQDVRQIFQTLK